jgi:hypothetical protein
MNKHQCNEKEMDFDEWKSLAQNDPATFETRRQQYLEAFIENAPLEKRRRLRGLQWQIDQTRNLAGSPLASCIAISNMMWDSLYQLNQQQRELSTVTPAQRQEQRAATTPATVLPFRAHHS